MFIIVGRIAGLMYLYLIYSNNTLVIPIVNHVEPEDKSP